MIIRYKYYSKTVKKLISWEFYFTMEITAIFASTSFCENRKLYIAANVKFTILQQLNFVNLGHLQNYLFYSMLVYDTVLIITKSVNGHENTSSFISLNQNSNITFNIEYKKQHYFWKQQFLQFKKKVVFNWVII